jgi:hypothetical protein
VGTVNARGFQNFPRGFMVNGEWERPQALRTGQNHEGFAVVVFTVAGNPDRSVFSLMVYGTSSDQVGYSFQELLGAFLSFKGKKRRLCPH